MYLPVFWRTYFQAFVPTFLFYTFFLTLLSFLFRFKELVFFLDSGASWALLGKFILYNVPFFFTLACPLSAAITGYLISNRLSQFGEWTALSTLGMPRLQILLPPLIIGFQLFVLVFGINADICPKYRFFGKKMVLEAIYQNPLLIAKHFQQKAYPIAVTGIAGEESATFDTVLIAACKEGGDHLDLMLLKNLRSTIEKGYTADEIIQIYHQDKGQIVSLMKNGSIDGSTIPTSFHFPKNYEEHIPLLAHISWTEVARRISISLLPMTLFLLTTAYGLYRNRRIQDKQLVVGILVAVSTYFCYLTVRSSTEPSLILYLLIPLIPLPFTFFRFSKELR
ncbi:MAG: LptF/LptG family permease [Chlamydiia bacterium]